MRAYGLRLTAYAKPLAIINAVILLSGAALVAQAPPRDQVRSVSVGTAEISGSVVTATDPAQPVRRAVVSLTRSGTEDTRTAITDERGQFAFSALPAGRYTLGAKKDPLLYFEYGAPKIGQPGSAIALADGQRFVARPMALTPGAVIAGRVTDRNGRGIAKVLVRATGVLVVAGERRERITGGSASTNPHGEYRIFGLSPGDYVVHASAGGLETVVTPAELAWVSKPEGPAPPGGRAATAAMTMYPGTMEESAAQVITLAAGEQRLGLDFPVQYVPVARVTLNITGVDGLPARGGTITQTPKRISSFNTAGTFRQPLGVSNVFTSVTPGDYVYYVRSDSRPIDASGQRVGAATPSQIVWGLAETTVAGEDVTLNIRLQPALSISGRIEFRSATGAGTKGDPTRVTVRAEHSGSVLSNVVLGIGRPDGTFAVDGLIPGASRLFGVITGEASNTWFVRSVMLGDRDLLDEPLEVGSVDASNIVVIVTDAQTQITGTLTDAAGQPAPLYVLLFPTDRAYWKPVSRRIAFSRANDAGRYEINVLPPGEYYLVALTEVDLQLRSEPSYLEQFLPLAMKIKLGEGEKKTQNLQRAK